MKSLNQRKYLRRHANEFESNRKPFGRLCALLLVLLLLFQWVLPVDVYAEDDQLLGSPSLIGTPTEAATPGDLEDPAASQTNLRPVPFGTACPAPAYCNDTGGCDCKDNPGNCSCPPTCLCQTIAVHACNYPDRCDKATDTLYPGVTCLCSTDGATVCICKDDCGCMMPNVTAETITKLEGVATSTDLSGKPIKVNINATLSSTDAFFDNIRIKTYLKAPLQIADIHLVDEFRLVSITTDSSGYTIVEVETDAGSFSGQYGFTAQFPPGLTMDAQESDVFTIIEADVSDTPGGTAKWSLIDTDNTVTGACAIAQASADWDITLKTVDLDYKSPSDTDNIFRYQVDLKRDNPGSNYGTLYMKDDSVVTLNIAHDSSFSSFPPGVNILRITRADGSAVPYTINSDGNPEILTKDIGMIFDQGVSNEYSASDKGQIFVVFKFDDNFYDDLVDPSNMVSIGGGFYRYQLESEAKLNYNLPFGSPEEDTDKQYLEALEYVPTKGGKGYFHKDALSHFIRGYNFFNYTSHASFVQYEDITYTVSFVNQSNTPVTGLLIIDERPTMHTYTGGTISDVSSAIDKKSVFFTSISISNWNGNDPAFVNGSTAACKVKVYRNGTLAETVDITAATHNFTSPEDITKLEVVVVDGSNNPVTLEHGFKLYLHVGVGGVDFTSLSSTDITNIRNEVNFVQNKASYSATSTEDPTKEIDGSSSTMVHIYPFEIEKKMWSLEGYIGQSAASQEFNDISLERGRDVYYKLVVYADNTAAHAYSPVFYIQVPPEVTIESAVASQSGSLKDMSFSPLTKVGKNPFGGGDIYRLEVADGTLLDPSAASNWGGNTVYGLGSLVLKGKLHGEALPGSKIDHMVYFGIKDPFTTLDETLLPSGYVTIGQLDSTIPAIAGHGLLSDDLHISVLASGRLEGEIKVQTELDRDSGDWHRHPEIAEALPGGQLNYRFIVRNGGALKAENIVLYNVFAHQQDDYIIGNGKRNSEWQPYLTGPVVVPSYVTVYYSESSDHKVATNGTYTGVDDWVLTPYDYPSVQSIKLVFDSSFVLPSGDEVEITVPMNSPIDYNFATGVNHLAISSLATQFNFEQGGTTQALEPLKVTVKLFPNTKGEISGMVWGDSDEDGDQGAKEYPLAGVAVELWEQGGSAALLKTTTDIKGAYMFTNLNDGVYYVKVIPLAGYNSVSLHGGALKNDFYLSSGDYRSPDITVNSTTKNHPDVDAAIHMAPATISGKVWQSMDGGVAYDSSRDELLTGINVSLYRMLGQGKRELYGIRPTIGGNYSFTGVPAGRYVVVFTVADNHSAADRIADSLPIGKPEYNNSNQGEWVDHPTTPTMESYEIRLEGVNLAGIDCGMKPDLGSISGTIWHDLNGDGARHPSDDAGLGGISITLTKTGGVDAGTPRWTDITILTQANGSYLFEDLLPGTYKVIYGKTTDLETDYFETAIKLTATQTDFVPEMTRDHVAEIPDLLIKPQDGAGALDLADYDIGLVKKLLISGRVYNDKNYSKTYNDPPTDEKLEAIGIKVHRLDSFGAVIPAQTQTINTAADELYSILLWPDDYQVEFPALCVQGADLWTPSVNYDDYLVVKADITTGNTMFDRANRTWTLKGRTSGQSAENVDLGLTRPRSIAGMVWLDEDGSALWESPETHMTRQVALQYRNGTAIASKSSAGVTGYDFDHLYPGEYRVYCDPAGTPNYVITNATRNNSAPDNNKVGLSPAGYYNIVIPNTDEGPAKDLKEIDFGLAVPVEITGKLWHDSDLNTATYVSEGEYNSSAGDVIKYNASFFTLYRWNDADNDYTIRTKDSNGVDVVPYNVTNNFQFKDLVPGKYQVRIAPTDSQYYRIDLKTALQAVSNPTASGNANYSPVDTTGITPSINWDNIVLRSGETIAGMDAAVGEYSSIGGTVWHDVNGNGQVDSGELPFISTAVELILYRHDGTSFTQYGSPINANGVNGTYAFDRLPPGQYHVVYKQGGMRVTNNPLPTDMTIDNDHVPITGRHATWEVKNASTTKAGYANKDYLLSAFGKITGLVWIDRDGDAVKKADPNGEKAPSGAMITIDYKSGPYQNWFDTQYLGAKTIAVDSNDAYAFEELWPGTYEITLSFLNDMDYIRTNTEPVGSKVTEVMGNDKKWTVALDSTNEEKANFGMVKPSKISGKIWHDENGNQSQDGLEALLGNIHLERVVTGNQATYSKTSTVTGNFSFEGLYPGTYKATITALNSNDLLTFFKATPDVAGVGSATVDIHTSVLQYHRATEFTVVIEDTNGDGIVVTNADFGYVSPSVIRAYVYGDFINGNGNQDMGELDLPSTPTLLRSTDGGLSYSIFMAPSQSVSSDIHIFADLLPGMYRIVYDTQGSKLLTTVAGKAANGTSNKATAVFARSAASNAIDAPGTHWNITIPQADVISVSAGIINPAEINGLVWKDLDADKAKHATDEFVVTEELTVELWLGGAKIAETKTHATAGTYQFTGLYPGTYTVKLTERPTADTWYVTNTGTGSDIKTYPWEHPSASLSIGATKTWDFGLTQPVIFTGTALVREYISGVASDTPVALGSVVTLYASDGVTVVTTAMTNANGEFTFTDIIPGAYEIKFTDAAYNAYLLVNNPVDTPGASRYQLFERINRKWKVKLPSGETMGNNDFVFSQDPVIAVVVWLDQNGDGIKDPLETAFSFAPTDPVLKVYEWDGFGSYIYKEDHTLTSSSNFAFKVVQGKRYKLELNFPSGYGLTNTTANLGSPTNLVTTPGSTTGHYIDIDIPNAGEYYGPYEFGLAEYIEISGLSFTEMDGNGSYVSGGPGEAVLPTHLLNIYRNGAFLLATNTNLQGEFSITKANHVLPGSFTVTYDAHANHGVTTRHADFNDANRTWSFVLSSGVSRTGVDIGFTPYREINGVIWEDANSDGAIDLSESKLSGKLVSLYKHNGMGFTLLITAPATSANGAYSFTTLPPGIYRVELSNPTAGHLRTNASILYDFTRHYEEHTFDAQDTSTSLTATINMGYVAPVTLSGRAFIDKNSDGVWDSGDAGTVVSVKVTHTVSNYTQTINTNADGTYTMANLPAGDYTVVFSNHPAGHSVSNQHADFTATTYTWAFSVLPGGQRSNLDIGYKSDAYLIKGVVWKDDNGNASEDSGETRFVPADGIEIEFTHGSYVGIAKAMLQSDGSFSAAMPGPGLYTIKALSLPAGYVITNREAPYDKASGTFMLTLTYANPIGEVAIGAARGQNISGMLFDDQNANGIMEAGDNPWANGTIELIDAFGNVEVATNTDSNGGYLFLGVKPGLYTVRLGAMSRYCFTGNNDPLTPAPIQSSFDLRMGVWQLAVGNFSLFNVNSGYCTVAKLEATVFDESTNQPVANSQVDLYRYDPVTDTYELWLTGQTDANGQYIFDNLLPGHYKTVTNIPSGYQKNPNSDGEQDQDTIVLEADLSLPGASERYETIIYRTPSPPGGPYPTPAPTPLPKPTPKPIVPIPPIKPEVPDGSFVDPEGNVIPPPATITPWDEDNNIYVEITPNGETGRMWQKVTVDGKTIYILVPDEAAMAYLPKTGEDSYDGPNGWQWIFAAAILMLLLAGMIIRKRSDAEK